MADITAKTPELTPSPIRTSVPAYDIDPSTGITWTVDPETGQPIAPVSDTRPSPQPEIPDELPAISEADIPEKPKTIEYWDANVNIDGQQGMWRKTEMPVRDTRNVPGVITANRTTPMLYRIDGKILEKPEQLEKFPGQEAEYESPYPAVLPPGYTTPSLKSAAAQREQKRKEDVRIRELRSALDALPPNVEEVGETGLADYYRSLEDARQKLSVAEQVRQAEQSWQESGQEMPPEVLKQIQRTKALVYGSASPFVDLATGQIDLVSAVRAGVPDEDLRAIGISQIDIVKARQAIRSQEQERKVGAEVRRIQAADGAEGERTVLPNLPEEYQIAYQAKDTATLQRLTEQYTVSQQEFEKWIASNEAPAELKDAYREGGIEGYSAAQVRRRQIKQATALSELERYRLPAEGVFMSAPGTPPPMSDNYDYFAFIQANRNNPDRVRDILSAVGFSKQQVGVMMTLDRYGMNASLPVLYKELSADDLRVVGFAKGDIDRIIASVETRRKTGIALPGESAELRKWQRDYEKAEAALNTVMSRIQTKNPTLSPQEVGRLAEGTPEYEAIQSL